MKAMILAAGLGSRLRPLTDSCPKALIDINGVPILEIVLRRLIKAGCREVIVNVFHFADMIVEFLQRRRNFGIRIEISRETELLNTGGGLKNAAHFFDDDQPFFLHNVDVLSNIDLNKMYRYHLENDALVTLAVQARQTSRYFLFDSNNALCGWESVNDGKKTIAKATVGSLKRLAFNGIHVISPRIFPQIIETGAFSIIQAYLRLAGGGEKILAFQAKDRYWWEIGRLEKLEEIRREVQRIQL